MYINSHITKALPMHDFTTWGIMDAEYSSQSEGESRLQDDEDLILSDSELTDATSTLCEEEHLEMMKTRMCPYGYEIVEDYLAASGAGTNEAPLDGALSDLKRQLETHREGEAFDWKKYAAKQGKILIGLLDWAHKLIDTAQSLQERLRDALSRLATAQDLVLALQREREEDSMVHASLEMQLHDNGIRLKTAQDRVTALENENRERATVCASVKRQVEYLDRSGICLPSYA